MRGLSRALPGPALRARRFSTALTDKHSRNLGKKFQISPHVSSLPAASPFSHAPRTQVPPPVSSGVVCGRGPALRVAAVTLREPLKGRASEASLSRGNLLHGRGGLGVTVSRGSHRRGEGAAAGRPGGSQRQGWHREAEAVGRGGCSQGQELYGWKKGRRERPQPHSGTSKPRSSDTAGPLLLEKIVHRPTQNQTQK